MATKPEPWRYGKMPQKDGKDSKDQKVATFQPNQILFRQGEKGGELYFIKKGQVELSVRSQDTGAEAVVAVLCEPSVIGTMSFLEGEPRSATAKCLTEVDCLVINAVQREKLLEQIPNWFKVLVKDLTANIRRLNEEYTKTKNALEIMQKRYEILKKKSKGEDDDKKPGEKPS
jgi:CRP-like cAMP-binding protein